MLIRALIVLLLVFNLGVALWWMLRPAPLPPAAVEPPAGVARLQAAPAEAPVEESRVVAAPVVDHCLSLGPFVDAASADRAGEQLRPLVLQLHQRRQFSGTPDDWRVFLPPFATAEQAEAAARKVAAAGFKDYFVMRTGAQANALALGVYANEQSVRARVAQLAEAGFAARVEPNGAGPAHYWLDLAVAAGFDVAAAQAQVGVDQSQALDCSVLSQSS